MSLQTIGITQDTPDRLLLDAGAIYKNLTYDDVTGDWTGTKLGATSGGNEFQVEIETRQPEIDGMKARIKGMKFVNSHNANLVVNLKEVTAENIRAAIGPADIDNTDDHYDVIEGRTTFKPSDYLENIAYVGRLSGNDKPVVIVLDNVVSAEGFSMNPQDNDEAIIPITFHAHLEFEDIGTDKVAYRIYYPKPAQNGGGV